MKADHKMLTPTRCACGCGETPKTPGAKWCAGHQRGRRNKTGFQWIEDLHYEVAESGCWEWLLSTMNGYGWNDGMAHRRGYESLHGKVPKGFDCHHVCGNPLCVNPEHLKVVEHSAHLKAHRRESSVLSEQDVIDMRVAAWHGETLVSLARRYGLGASAVGRVVRGDNWPDVGGPVGRPVKTCGRCGASVVGRGRKAIYCSLECQEKINKEKARMKMAA